MEIQFLKLFLTIVREGNLSRAADKLFITQPTLSRQLSDIEKQLDVQLFVRGKRQMTLTEAGLIFEKRAKEILNLVEQTEEELKQNPNNLVDTIRIGAGETNVSILMADLIEKFSELNPFVKFELFSGNGDGVKEKIDQNQIDCAFLIEPIEVAKYNSTFMPVYERWGVILPNDHPLSVKGAVDGIDIVNLPLVGTNRSIVLNEVAQWLGKDINEINFKVKHNLLSNSLHLAKKDIVYPFVVEGAFVQRPMEGLKFIPLNPARLSAHVFVYKKNTRFNPSVERFIEFVKEEIKTIH